mgnify:CR=1 FL=1
MYRGMIYWKSFFGVKVNLIFFLYQPNSYNIRFFYNKYPIALIGLLIGSIPETKNEINNYKETGKLSVYLVVQGFVFITTIYIIISTMLGI